MKRTPSILFFGKEKDKHCRQALDFINNHFNDVTSYLGKWGDSLPDNIESWNGDYIISYLSRWIIPESLITKAKIAAINFHPASPNYPGIGCNNFALYEEALMYGVTCHHMTKNVDTGDIILTKKFPILDTDSVETLLARTYDAQLDIFFEIMNFITKNTTLPTSDERWRRKPFTRKEFNQLSIIEPSMSVNEISKRIRATNYKNFKPILKVGPFRFQLTEEKQ